MTNVQYLLPSQVCPSGWKPGDKGMTADQDKAQEYFKSKYEEDGHGEA